MKNKFIKRIILFTVATTLIGLSAWYFYFAQQIQAKTQKNEKLYTVNKQNISQSLTLSGKLEADEKAVLKFQSSGMLSWVGVKVGDKVKKYQAIASIDKRELQKNLEKYLLTYMKTRWDFDQTKDEYRQPAQGYWGLTWDQRNDIDRALQKAQFDLNSSVLDVELKDIALKYANLISPIDGIVTRIDVPYAGINITPAGAEFEIVNPNSLYFSVLADQTEVISLSKDMSSELIFDAYPSQKKFGVVREISYAPKSGESGTVYEIKIQLPEVDIAGSQYRLGMTGDAAFVLNDRRDVIAIPVSAVKTDGDKKYVYRKIDNKKKKTTVEIGIESDSFLEITAGLAEGDIIYD